jgi:hypothetical protein
LTETASIDYIKFLSAEAAKYSMAVGLKNAMGILKDVEPLIHFAVNEQCSQFNECSVYESFIKTKPVFHIEYPNGQQDKAVSDSTKLNRLCKDTRTSDEEDAPIYDITKFSTVIKGINLTGFVQYCDAKTYKTPTLGSQSSTQAPKQDTPTPEKPAKSPKKPTQTPGEPAKDPEKPTQDPEEPTQTPGEPTKDPKEPAQDPEEPTQDPEEPTQDPEEPTQDPEEPTQDPEEPTQDPEDPTHTPGEPAQDPKEPAQEPEETT